MTPFEQAVAAALIQAMFDAQEAGAKPLWPETIMPHLAPRVAAAIEAAGRVVVDGFVVARADRDAALAALRGEP